MTSAGRAYQFEALLSTGAPVVRIVEILPSPHFSAPVSLGLSHHMLHEASFEALSYTWGTAPADVHVYLEGCDFLVSPDLESSIRHLRYSDRSRKIWIDAICLNQADDTEKSTQIPIMHLIYQRATQVVVYLGVPSRESHLAMEYVRNVTATVEVGRQHEISDLVAVKDWPLELLVTAPLSRAEIESLTAFYQLLMRPWWFRAWIVQELCYATRVVFQCGGDVVDYELLRVALHITRKLHPVFVTYEDVIEAVMGDHHDFDKEWPAKAINTALNLDYGRKVVRERHASEREDHKHTACAEDASWALWMNKHRLCREAHDLVFSVLGLAGTSFRRHFRPNYTLTIREHDRSVVEAFVAATGSLDVIFHSQHSIWLLNNPSWAPDWGQRERAGVFHLNGQKLPIVEPLAKENVEISFDEVLLHIRGRIIGTVHQTRLEEITLVRPPNELEAVTMPVTSGAARVSTATPDRRWWLFKEAYEHGELFQTALDCLAAKHPLWQMHLELFLIMVVVNFEPRSSFSLPEEWLYAYSTQDIAVGQHFEDVEQFWDLLEYLLMSRTICKLDDGKLAVAPDVAEAGDRVAILAGCSNPAILRESADGTFRLLGDGHVLGVCEAEMDLSGVAMLTLS